jgi:tetratricopeptide (TPR) repeat protein
LLEIAYAISLFGQYFPASLFLRLFEEEGKNPAMVSRALDMLSSRGLIDCREDPLPGIPGFVALAEKNLGAGTDLIHTMVRSRLLAWVNAGKLRPGFNLLRALAALGEIASEELVLEALRRDLINGTGGNLRKAIEESRLADFTGPAHLPALLSMQQTLESLLRGDEGDIAAAFRAPLPPEETPSYKVCLLVHQTAYMLGVHDTDKASELIKEAIIISQHQGGGRGLAQSHRLFSLVNLSKGRLADAIDYSAFAMEQAEKAGDFEESALDSYYAAALQFLFGNISKAERLATKAEETALKAGQPLWAYRIRFLRGKLLFEAGRYKESLNAFGELRRNPFGTLPEAAEDTLEAWIYRAAVFFEGAGLPGSVGIPKPQRPNTDARVFEIEASYLSGEYQKTVELSDKLLTELPDSEFLFSEQPDWRSGFSQEELLIFSPREFRAAMISAYRALGLCRLGKAGREEARHIIERIIQNERISGTDPNGAFYFFAYYRILGESGAAGVDMDTAVSMAYKRLQRRASRIDDTETNRSFLSRHYWNGALSRAAKEHKLI